MIESDHSVEAFPHPTSLNQSIGCESTPLKLTAEDKGVYFATRERTFPPKKFRKNVWTKGEDELLMTKIEEMGAGQWAKIAESLPQRSGKQCRERWHNHLRKGVKKDPWQAHQYWILALSVRAFGRKWSKVAEQLAGRSDNTIKNQWNCKMKPYKQQFNENIDRLLCNPELRVHLSQKQNTLLEIIERNNEGRIESESLNSLHMLEDIIQEMEFELRQFKTLKKEIKNEVLEQFYNEEQSSDYGIKIESEQYIYEQPDSDLLSAIGNS